MVFLSLIEYENSYQSKLNPQFFCPAVMFVQKEKGIQNQADVIDLNNT
jgi:hypothetical protein